MLKDRMILKESSSVNQGLITNVSPVNLSRVSSWILLFFAWFFILPSNFCSYAPVLAEHTEVTANLFYIITNLAGIFGLISAGIIALFQKRTYRLILIISILLLISNVTMVAIQPKSSIALMAIIYFFLGQYVTLSTVHVFQTTTPTKFYKIIGIVLICVALFSLFFNLRSSGTGSALSVYVANLGMNIVVLPFVIAINTKVLPINIAENITKTKKLNHYTLILNAIYTFVFSFALGIFTDKLTVFNAPNLIRNNLILTVTYILAIVFLYLISKKQQFGISMYISNMLLVLVLSIWRHYVLIPYIALLFAICIGCATASNILFIFDTSFELASSSKKPSLLICVNLSLLIGGNSLGDHLTDYFHELQVIQFDRVVVALIAFATCLLPIIRINLTKLASASLYRVNPVLSETSKLDTSVILPGSDLSVDLCPAANQQSTPCGYEVLTARETEVLALLLVGYPSDLIASKLFISSNTLKRHTQNIYNKLGVHSRSELFKLFKDQ